MVPTVVIVQVLSKSSSPVTEALLISVPPSLLKYIVPVPALPPPLWLESLTVKVHMPYLPELYVDVALIVVVPTATAVTRPLSLTVATFVSIEDHVTV